MRVATLAMATFCALAAAAALAQSDAPSGVMVDEVRVAEFAETAPVVGRMVAATRSVVASRVAGIVERVEIEVGDSVARGDVLARLDATRLEIDLSLSRAELAQAEADLEAAEADVTLAEQALDRIARLEGSGAFSQGVYDDRRSELARAVGRRAAFAARVERARAEIDRVRYDISHMAVRAPFDGAVIERWAEPGAYLSVGDRVATLLDIGDLEIEADAPTEYVAALRPGLEVEARIGAGTVATATVRAVVPEEAVATRTRPVRFEIALGEAGVALAAGQSVTLMLPVAEPRPALTVHKDAVTQGPRGWTAFVAKDGVAELRQVELGRAIGARLEALSGLEAGELVVIRGNERLRPGQKIAPSFADGAPAPRQG